MRRQAWTRRVVRHVHGRVSMRIGKARLGTRAALCALAVGVVLSCDTKNEESASLSSSATQARYNWLQFGGDSRHGGNNTLETQITPQNASGLQQLFKINLPETIEGAPVVLTNVSTSSGMHDLAYVTTRSGYIVALDAYTGATIWSAQPASTNITMSSPAVDPSLQYVYSAGLDGYVHKYQVGNGAEVTGGGWPELSTLKINVEKDGTAITIGTVGSTNYLYMGVGGYDGDGGDYQGHVTTIDLSTGAQTVFNAMCSNQTIHFTSSTPDCAGQKSGIWAKAGVVYDPATNRLYAGTGNGTFNPSQNYWGDTILALNPDGTGTGGDPVDSYTPTNFQTLQNSDLDLGSTNVLILPNNGSKYAHLALLSGKDARVRLVNLDNMSGQGGPGHTGGEIASIPLQTGGEVQNPIASWINPADATTWAFIVSPSNGINAVHLVVDGGGNPSLVPVWSAGGGGGGAAIANGVLYYASNNNLHALNPVTGAQLWNNTGIGQIHWQTPAIVNGVVYIGDNGRQLTAFALPGSTPPPNDAGSGDGAATDAGPGDGGSTETALPRTGWVATASNTSGDVPANALDGNEATRFSTGAPMANGMWFQVDMQAARTFDQITMDSGGSANDYARGYAVYASSDGVNFGNPIATGTGTAPRISVSFATQTARYLKIVQTGAASFWWSLAELNVYTSGATADAGAPETGAAEAGAPETGTSETALPRTGWVATASNTSGDVPANALDGNEATRFSTGTPMANGMWFQVDMQAARTFNQITMDSGGSANDYARGYAVYASSDGVNFGNPIATGTGTAPRISVSFATQTARYLKIVQTGAASFWWSLAELDVYTQ